MLGVGPDTHVASLFPELPAVRETERTVVGVHGAPKPPPTRISLTLPAIRAAREVWLLAAGEDKARAAATALSGAGEVQAPAAGAYGRARTLWLLDAGAAAQLPRSLYTPASPRAPVPHANISTTASRHQKGRGDGAASQVVDVPVHACRRMR